MTRSQCTCETLPLSQPMTQLPGVKWKLPMIFSSKSVSFITRVTYGLTPMANSPM